MNPRLYVGNLSPEITEAELRLLFSRVGEVSSVQLMLDPTTHQSRGQAYVTMATAELAAAALNELHSYSLGGRYIVVTETFTSQEAKVLISEGTDFVASTVPRRGAQRGNTRRAASRFPRRRRQKR